VAESSQFSRKLPLEPWPEPGVTFVLEAGPAERRMLAERFGLEALEALRAEGRLERLAPGGDISLAATIEAQVVQTCVVSLEPVAAAIAQPVRLLLRPVADAAAARQLSEAPFDPEAVDIEPVAGSAIPLGELLVEEFALALDPYPRRPDAYAELPDLGPDVAFGPVLEREHPFAVLGVLKQETTR
jgi:hypothetical protein